jgi:UDP-N-acetylmuramoylalanine--D-glutamate ligase
MKTYSKALVCGLGDSGESSVELLLKEESAVTLIDKGDTPALREKARVLEEKGARILLGVAEVPKDEFEVCITSPGLALQSPWLTEISRRGIHILSELELGWSRHRGKAVAVTGSNGKSSAVKWLSESLQQAGLRAMPVGNYGLPVTRAVLAHPELDWMVIEVSSFQLETVHEFRPDVGVLLNVNPNHLDRHGSMEGYKAMKARLFSRTTASDRCIVYRPLLEEIRRLSGGSGQWFSFGASEDCDYFYRNGQVWRQGRALANLDGTYFGNDILGLAAASIVAAAEGCGISPMAVEKAARAFQPLPHRMQKVRELQGVVFINDSKATNLSAMAAALTMMKVPVRLIAGGLVKEKDFSFVKELLAQKVRGVYLIGKASDEMASAWSDVAACFKCGTLDSAVQKAWSDAERGEAILLSPACASFDQFRNFEERGDHFAKVVEKLDAKIA